jgi:hypothetical protein
MMNAEPVRFDLATGQVETDAGERLLLIPHSVLDELAETEGMQTASRLARGIGASIGRRVAGKLGSIDGVRGASLEAFVTELALQMAISGWGSPSLERWGKAMVVSVDHAPVKERGLVAALVESTVGAAADREVHGVVLAGGGPVRVLLTSAKGAVQVRGWMAEGVSGGEIIARLHVAAIGAGE